MFGRIRIDALRLMKPEITLKDVPSLVTGPDQTLAGAGRQSAEGRADRRAALARWHALFPDGDRHRGDQEDRCALRRKLRHRSDVELRLLRVPERDGALRARLRRADRDGGRASAFRSISPSPPSRWRPSSPAPPSFANGFQLDGDLRAEIGERAAFLPMGRHPLAAGAQPEQAHGSGYRALERHHAHLRRRHLLA